MSLEFASRLVLGEGPVDRFTVTIARVRLRQDGSLLALKRRNTAVKTLLRQRRELDLRHIEP
jgi:hypothetical protein